MGVHSLLMLHTGTVESQCPLMDPSLPGHPSWKTLEKDVPKVMIVHRNQDVPQCLQLHAALGGLFQMTEQCFRNHAEIGSCLKHKPWISMHKKVFTSDAVRSKSQKWLQQLNLRQRRTSPTRLSSQLTRGTIKLPKIGTQLPTRTGMPRGISG